MRIPALRHRRHLLRTLPPTPTAPTSAAHSLSRPPRGPTVAATAPAAAARRPPAGRDRRCRSQARPSVGSFLESPSLRGATRRLRLGGVVLGDPPLRRHPMSLRVSTERRLLLAPFCRPGRGRSVGRKLEAIARIRSERRPDARVGRCTYFRRIGLRKETGCESQQHSPPQWCRLRWLCRPRRARLQTRTPAVRHGSTRP